MEDGSPSSSSAASASSTISSSSSSSESSSIRPSKPNTNSLTRPLLSGALAGTTVDVLLYPLDTLKTRLQSSRGFIASGGFRGVYAGLGSVILGSAPSGALFFVVYEGSKNWLSSSSTGERVEGTSNAPSTKTKATTHMLAASLGEIAACAVRVPIEVIKQRTQAGQYASSIESFKAILSRHRTTNSPQLGRHGKWMMRGVIGELYIGWGITILREVPFTMIQFPLWEALRSWSARRRGRDEATAVESALWGCVSGAVAGGLTTPLDVVKTRMMLAGRGGSSAGEVSRGTATMGMQGKGKAEETRIGIGKMTRRIWREEGSRAFFKGFVPRTLWISVGGAVFLGSYQWCWNLLGGVV